MALNKTNKLVWLVETILHAQKITFQDLSSKWQENTSISGGKELPTRSFHNWKNDAEDLFGLSIECEKVTPYRYYIANADEIKQGTIEKWLLSTLAVNNSLLECRSIKDRIILEDIPSGQEYLHPVVQAIKNNRFVHFQYYNYWTKETKEFFLMPLCLKLFRQRWYIVGRLWPSGTDSIFCLDRFRDFRLSSHTFEYPDDFNPQEFFDGCYGIIANDGCPTQLVKLKVSAEQANYLRDLPLHQSQVEVEQNSDFSIFTLNIRPTFDFQQEILWNGHKMEVIEPSWLRDEISSTIDKMRERYSKRGGDSK